MTCSLKNIPEVEQVDFAAEFDKKMVKEVFDSNVIYGSPQKQDSFTDSGSDYDGNKL